MTVQLSAITFDEIYPIWSTYLWPDRLSDITPNSAMCFLEGYDSFNMEKPPTFFAIFINGEIAGVNSGHSAKTFNIVQEVFLCLKSSGGRISEETCC